jgi:hypothetical protein
MKNVLKLAMVGSALAASSAFAVTVDPGLGNGEFVLYARDTATNVTFAKGLLTQIDSVATRAAIAGDSTYTYPTGGTLNFTLPPVDLSSDANWNSFKSAAGSDNIVWTVLAGDSQQALNQPGAERYAISTQTDLTHGGSGGGTNPPSNSAIRSVWSGLHGLQADMLGVGTTGDGASAILAANAGAGWGNPTGVDSLANTMFSSSGISNENVLGTAGNFYFITSNSGGSSALGRVYTLGHIEFDANGHLFSTPVSSVPLPAAVWLFGSGLLGLVGIGRRKQVAAA